MAWSECLPQSRDLKYCLEPPLELEEVYNGQKFDANVKLLNTLY